MKIPEQFFSCQAPKAAPSPPSKVSKVQETCHLEAARCHVGPTVAPASIHE